VNLGSRLETATKEHDVDCLISEETVKAAWGARGDLPALEDKGELEIRGRTEPVRAFALRV
jgi:class 3 adenylate cyclase